MGAVTATSPLGGRRLFRAAEFDGSSPLGAATCRDTLFNNALHAADELAPVWISWIAADASAISGNPPQYIEAVGAGIRSNAWAKMAVFGPFNLPFFADRKAYKLRCSIFGASSAGGTNVKLAITVATASASIADLVVPSSTTNIIGLQTAVTSSTTPADLALSETLTGAPTNLITPTDQVEAGMTLRATLDDTGGSPVNASTCELMVYLWGQSANIGAAKPRCYGMTVAGYVG